MAVCGPLGIMSMLCALTMSRAFGSRSCLTTTSPNSGFVVSRLEALVTLVFRRIPADIDEGVVSVDAELFVGLEGDPVGRRW